jgi:hypothetical protein
MNSFVQCHPCLPQFLSVSGPQRSQPVYSAKVPYKPEYKATPYFSNEKIRKSFFYQNLIFHLVLGVVSKKEVKTILF